MRSSSWVMGGVFLAVSSVSSLCAAQSAPRTHDGFYFQGALGGGYLHASAENAGTEVSYYGGAVTGSLWFGGTVAPGLVLGGGTFGAVAPGPSVKFKIGGVETTGSADSDTSLNLNMLGAFVDYYLDPHEGLHLQAMVAYAVLSASNDNDTSDNNPSGVGLLAGVGYDFWVGEQWSLGVLGRFAYAAVSRDDVGFPTLVPSLQMTVTYH